MERRVQSIPTESERRRALRGLRIYFAHRRWPRFTMTGILVASGGGGFFAAHEMLRAGLTPMWVRYPLAVFAAWAVFLALMRGWAALEARWFLPAEQLDAMLKLPDPGTGPRIENGLDCSWLEWVLEIPSGASAEGCVVWLAMLALLVIAVFTVAGIVSIVISAPALIAEVFLDSALVAALYRRMNKIEQRWWLGGAISQTWAPVAVTALALMIVGLILHALVPGAHSIAGGWWHYHPQPLEGGLGGLRWIGGVGIFGTGELREALAAG
jgi:hypothetical protein